MFYVVQIVQYFIAVLESEYSTFFYVMLRNVPVDFDLSSLPRNSIFQRVLFQQR